MTPDLQAWHTHNDEYLAAALAELRHRVDKALRVRFVPPQQPPASPVATAATSEEPRKRAGLFRRPVPQVNAVTPILLPSSGSTPGSANAGAVEAELARRLAQAARCEPPPALVMLARQFGLDGFVRDVLLLCVAMELDPALPARLAALQGCAEPVPPSFGLAMNLFENPVWEAVSPEGPLRHWRLIDIHQSGAMPLTRSGLRADERIVNFIKGLNHLDDRLTPLVSPVSMLRPEQLAPSHEAKALALKGSLREVLAVHGQGVVALRGRDRPSKHELAGAVAGSLGLQLYRLPTDVLPTQMAEVDALARLWHRECLLMPLALLIDAHALDRSSAPDSPVSRLVRFVARTGGLLFVDSRDGIDLSIAPHLTADVEKPTPVEQRQAWQDGLADIAPDLAPRLSAQFDLNRPDLAAIVGKVAPLATTATAGVLEDSLWRACKDATRPQLARLAQRLDARATFDDIVLPPSEMALLRQIGAQIGSRSQVYDTWGFRARMNRGLGVSALFAGDSGTGKTMAAEVLANTLRLDLFRIDLSAVVSKYIGETEKNLREVFDAAETGGAILLFDEADALFGKRSEVKDSHDRYANIEIDYLLQRMESFGGLAILATNMKSALDAAFIRRLRFIVNFAYPGQAERRRMWERAFPADTPVGVLDLERLARLNLSGANIQSMALTAAFLAAQAGTPVTMALLMEAGRMELRKLDRPINESDFRCVEAAAAAGTAT